MKNMKKRKRKNDKNKFNSIHGTAIMGKLFEFMASMADMPGGTFFVPSLIQLLIPVKENFSFFKRALNNFFVL